LKENHKKIVLLVHYFGGTVLTQLLKCDILRWRQRKGTWRWYVCVWVWTERNSHPLWPLTMSNERLEEENVQYYIRWGKKTCALLLLRFHVLTAPHLQHKCIGKFHLTLAKLTPLSSLPLHHIVSYFNSYDNRACGTT